MDVASISTGWALVQKQTILNYGLDADELYRQENLDLSLISNPEYRYPAIPFNRIWHKLEQLTGDSNVGLTAASFVLPTTFHALGLAMWSSCNLSQALERLLTYSKIFHNGGSIELIEQAQCYQMKLTRKISSQGVSLVTNIGVDCLFSALIKLFSQLRGEAFVANKISFARARPLDVTQYNSHFNCPLEFDAEDDAIFIHKADYHQPFPSGNAELANINDTIARQQLARIDNSNIVTRIRQLIQQNLQNGEVNQDMIANQLAMSVRTLQRALKAQQTTFKKEFDLIRQELAKSYIHQAHLTLGEISFLLGFSIQNNFSRSFKQWFGMGPAEYRKQLV